MDRHHYYIDNHWDSNRNGIVCSPRLSARQSEKGCIEVNSPPQFPRGTPGIWSPEHLLTAAAGGSFMTTFVAIAENSKLNFRSFDCRATGVLEQVDGKLMMTEIQLEPAVLITNGKDHDLTLRILRETKKNCLICNSIKTKITMYPWIEVLQLSVDEDNLLVQ